LKKGKTTSQNLLLASGVNTSLPALRNIHGCKYIAEKKKTNFSADFLVSG